MPSLFAVPLVFRAHWARFAESRVRKGMVASAPRVDMGPGLPATACRQCRTATSHDELPLLLLHRVKRATFFSEEDCGHVQSIYTNAGARGAHMPSAPCSNSSCHSKKAKSALSIPRQRFTETKQSGRSAQQRRWGEYARIFRVAFRRKLRTARPARISARLRLLKACESRLKKPSACTMAGALAARLSRIAIAGDVEAIPDRERVKLFRRTKHATWPIRDCGSQAAIH
jgi:hypothetical protein